MTYSIYRTNTFNDQLHDIIFYIAEVNSKEVALDYLFHIEKGIQQLSAFPHSGIEPRYQVLRRQGYQVLVIERHILFYKILETEKRLILYAIFDVRQEYLKLI